MFQILILALSGLAFAQDAEEAAPAEEIAAEGEAAGEDIPETDAETAGTQAGEAVEAPAAPAISPEQAAEMEEVQARLGELGECDIRKKKKKARCVAEKADLELKLAELQPPPPTPAATRAVPAEEMAEEAADAEGAAEDMPLGEEEGLELDVGDE